MLATDALTAEVFTDRTIAAFTDVPSGSTVLTNWSDLADGEHSWYVVTSDPYGAVGLYPVSTFTVDQTGGYDGWPPGNSNGKGHEKGHGPKMPSRTR